MLTSTKVCRKIIRKVSKDLTFLELILLDFIRRGPSAKPIELSWCTYLTDFWCNDHRQYNYLQLLDTQFVQLTQVATHILLSALEVCNSVFGV